MQESRFYYLGENMVEEPDAPVEDEDEDEDEDEEEANA
jgi:hypothetical protein